MGTAFSTYYRYASTFKKVESDNEKENSRHNRDYQFQTNVRSHVLIRQTLFHKHIEYSYALPILNTAALHRTKAQLLYNEKKWSHKVVDIILLLLQMTILSQLPVHHATCFAFWIPACLLDQLTYCDAEN